METRMWATMVMILKARRKTTGIDTTIACPIEADSCHYLRNGLADVGRVTGGVIRYEQPEPMRL